jgi:serine/threonine protein kinase
MAAVKQPGDWIADRFQIFEVHEGGMGVVYVVNDHMGAPGRQIMALKTLRDDLLRHRSRRSRFATECRLWVQLGHHPNIVQAHAVEILENRPYVILELIQGGDLDRWIGSPRLDLVQSLRFGVQFCQGLEHAVRSGLHCHRDIKPANLMIGDGNTLKITDFGLARISDEMVSSRRTLPDGSIPLAEPTVHRAISWSDPLDRLGPSSPDNASVSVAVSSSSSAARPALRRARQTAVEPDSASLSSIPLATPKNAQRPGLGSTIDWETPGPAQTDDGEIGLAARGADGGVTDVNATADANSSRPATYDPRLTQSDARIGTRLYMAPEQVRDPRSVDSRADIYSFGVVLFEMIAGERPFKGKSPELIERQHARYAPPSLIPSIPHRYRKVAAAIDAIVQRCLKKDPADRYPKVADLRKALLRALSLVGARP